MTNVVQPGDRVRVKWNKDHDGIVGTVEPGNITVIHNVKAGGVMETAWDQFQRGRSWYIVERAQPGQELAVVERARALIGSDYNMFFFNCEHLATLATTGHGSSQQVQDGVVKLTFSAILAAAAYSVVTDDGTYIDDQGRRRDSSGRFA